MLSEREFLILFQCTGMPQGLKSGRVIVWGPFISIDYVGKKRVDMYFSEENLSLFQGICDTETAREYFRTSTVTPAESTTTSTTTPRYLDNF